MNLKEIGKKIVYSNFSWLLTPERRNKKTPVLKRQNIIFSSPIFDPYPYNPV